MDAYDQAFGQLDAYKLYDSEIEGFFIQNALTRIHYRNKEKILPKLNCGPGAVIYVYVGNIKIYTLSLEGRETFQGFIPRYSTIMSVASEGLGKFMRAAGSTTLLIAMENEYLDFIMRSRELVHHQLTEAFWRRNANELPRYETAKRSSKDRVVFYIMYLAKRFGKPVPHGAGAIMVENPPSLKDVASYNGVHPNNVSSIYNELKGAGVIEFSTRDLVILDPARLEAIYYR